ncbi:MAG: DUF1566 domain-containing protein [Bacteroidetes bacterium]|nr:DUF1566 domain-containing protein [Bacteroidota bacterium]
MKHLTSIIIASFLFPFFVNCQTDSSKTLSIGDHYQGGIIFYIDQSGQHGLIAAPNDQTERKIKWGVNGNTYAIFPDDGEFNMKKILDFHNYTVGAKGKAAAYLCDSLRIEGYSDWYLPAIEELKMMYDKKSIIGNFMSGDYCSSTEYGERDVYSIHFRKYSSIIFFHNKENRNYFVRCIRRF